VIDRSIDPTADQVRALRDQGPEGPIVMVNLLKFRASAHYDAPHGEPARTGEEAYALYKHAFSIAVKETSEAEIVFYGAVNQVFIGQVGGKDTDWDKVLIVRYPSRQHFLAMMRDDRYRDALRHRYAGLERTVLLQCQA
jgi:uncharacterized protein (DUF1330 family)